MHVLDTIHYNGYHSDGEVGRENEQEMRNDYYCLVTDGPTGHPVFLV